MKLSTRICLLAAASVVFSGLFIGLIFWAEISQAFAAHQLGQYSDTGWSHSSHLLPVDQTDRISDVVLGDRKSKIPSAKVLSQRLKDHQGDVVTVALDLQSTSLSTAYPSLLVVMLGSDNAVLRTFTLSNADYRHGLSLTQEPILLKLQTLPDEARLTVKPFYPGS